MKSAVCMTIAASVFAASAEPVVLTWTEGFETVNLDNFSAEVPPLELGRKRWDVSGNSYIYPHIGIAGWDTMTCDPPPFAGEYTAPFYPPGMYNDTPMGALISDALSGWTNALYCYEWNSSWPQILGGSYEFSIGAEGCPPFAIGFGLTMSEGVSVVPVRFTGDSGEWHYGWIAFLATEVILPDCEMFGPPDLIPIDMRQDECVYIGFGYETEPDTPIINGGGLCEADLTFDAVLDLDDLGAFVQAFIGADLLADMNGDGVLDLADVQRFIDSFVSGCDL